MHRENYFRCVRNVEMNSVEVNALPTNIPTLRCFLFVKPCSVCVLVFVLIFTLPTNILALRWLLILKPVIPFFLPLLHICRGLQHCCVCLILNILNILNICRGPQQAPRHENSIVSQSC